MPPPGPLWALTALTASRLLAAVLFACVVYQVRPTIAAVIYAVAAVSDLVDGQIARRLHVSTLVGNVADLVSDKTLTMVSVIYASSRGLELAPLAIIAARDVIMLGARIVRVDDRPLLLSGRVFGGGLAALVWGCTLCLVLVPCPSTSCEAISRGYWLAAGVAGVNTLWRLGEARARIKSALNRQ